MEHRSHMVWRAPLLRTARIACGMLGALAASAALASPASAALSFTVPTSVDEGDSVDITVTRPSGADAAKELDVTVQAKDGSAKAPEDFDATAQVVHFKANQLTKDAAVKTVDDDLDENDENFKIAIDSGAPDDPEAKKLTITDDDDEPTIALGPNVSAAEGTTDGTTAFNFEVKLSQASGRSIAVPYDVWDSSAIEPQDFTNGHETLVIPPYVTTATITVPVVADNVDEPDEKFEVELDIPNHGTLGKDTAWGTIVNDDFPSLSIADARVREGEAGTTAMVFTVTMSNPSSREIDVTYATAAANTGGAKEQEDFTNRGGVMIFSPGETTDSFQVLIKGDKGYEADENFVAALSNPQGATLARAFAFGTIENDDPAPAASASATPTPAATPAARRPAASRPAATAGRATSNRLTLTRPTFARPSRVRTALSCPAGAGTCQGTVSIFTVPSRKAKIPALRRELKIGTARFTAPGGRRVIVGMRPSPRMLALLRRAGTVRVHAYVVATDARGKVLTKEILGTLRVR